MNKLKQLFKRTVFGSLLLVFMSNVIAAPQITGTLAIGGALHVLDSNGNQTGAASAVAIDFDFFGFDKFVVNAADGSFAGLAGTYGDIKDFNFDPFNTPIADFWTTAAFSFKLTDVSRGFTNDPDSFLVLDGVGIISAAGFEDAAVNWRMSANTSGGGLFSWSATFTVQEPEPVPEVLILLSVDASTAGTLVVTGIAGSVDANATVAITNTSNNETTTVTADTTGAFTATINGNSGDVLNFTVTEVNGAIYNGIPYTVGLIQIIAPTNNSLINANEVNVYGTFSGGSNTGINVNGETACTYNNNFYVNNLPLTSGANTLTATYTTQSGSTQNTAINVTQSGLANYRFSTDQNCGLAPLNATFNLDAGSNIIQQLDIDYDADGTIDLSTTTPATAILQHNYTAAGVYPVTAWVTSGGVTQQLNLNIVVNDETQQDDTLKEVWNGMWVALKTGDKPTAMQYFTPEGVRTYGGIFDSLMPFMTETFDELSVIEPININTEIADYAVIRLENGVIKTFMINFTRGNDGVWRIDSM